MRHFMLLIGLMVGLFSGCDKKPGNQNINPPANYCRCLVNGKSWEAGSSTSFSNALSARFNSDKNFFILDCRSDDLKVITIGLLDSTTINIKSGTFILNGRKINSYSYYGNYAVFRDNKKSSRYGYSVDSSHTGYLTLIIDEIGKRVSGTFSFIGVSEEGTGEEMNITNGEFSLRID